MTPDEQKTQQEISSFLSGINVCSVATVDAQCLPHAANVYFASDPQLCLYFVSHAESQHVRDVLARPNVAVSAFKPMPMWQQVCGMQMHGTCARVPDAEWDATWKLYLAKYPHMIEIEGFVRSAAFYRVTPEWVRWIDNSVHFGYTSELRWPLD